MALLYNPANLTNFVAQLHVSAHMLLFSRLRDPRRVWVRRSALRGGLRRRAKFGFVPEVALSWGVNDRLGFGIGLLFDGGRLVLLRGDPETGRVGANPAPTRYSLIDQTNLIAFLAAGVGYKFHDRFRAAFM